MNDDCYMVSNIRIIQCTLLNKSDGHLLIILSVKSSHFNKW